MATVPRARHRGVPLGLYIETSLFSSVSILVPSTFLKASVPLSTTSTVGTKTKLTTLLVILGENEIVVRIVQFCA